jgi:alpha-aminoadipate carrier protein LysW
MGVGNHCHFRPEGPPLVHCPKCAVEVDVDEDEVEEGEILTCPGCEAELEVVQIHPVRVDVISADEDDDDEEVAAAEGEEDDDEDDDEEDDDDLLEDEEDIEE